MPKKVKVKSMQYVIVYKHQGHSEQTVRCCNTFPTSTPTGGIDAVGDQVITVTNSN